MCRGGWPVAAVVSGHPAGGEGSEQQAAAAGGQAAPQQHRGRHSHRLTPRLHDRQESPLSTLSSLHSVKIFYGDTSVAEP
jgi:hypothetical protein